MIDTNDSNDNSFLKVYYEFMWRDMSPVECMMYSAICSWIDTTKAVWSLECTLAIFNRINRSDRQKKAVIYGMRDRGYISLGNQKKKGRNRFYIKVIKKPSNLDAHWNIKWADIIGTRDYSLLLVRSHATSISKRFSCVNYDSFIKSGLLDVKTISKCIKKLNTQRPFRVGKRLYYCNKNVYPDVFTAPTKTPTALGLYNGNDIYAICKAEGWLGADSIEVLRNLNSLGLIEVLQPTGRHAPYYKEQNNV